AASSAVAAGPGHAGGGPSHVERLGRRFALIWRSSDVWVKNAPMKRALVGRCGAVVAAVFGLAGCGDDPESSSEQGVDALETGSGADAEAAAAAEAEANAAAQADFYGLGRRVEIEVELDPADWAALRQEGRSV